MTLGWVDYSKEDKKRALDLLDSIYETGALDELGFAPVRDAFANTFFPGITTIQTKAKYFLIVPYALIDIYKANINDYDKALKKLYMIENGCCSKMAETNKKNKLDNKGLQGGTKTGSKYIGDPDWIKRKPSEIYWSGLQTYEIFKENITLWNYIKICSNAIEEKNEAIKSGKMHNVKDEKNRNFDENSSDDVNPYNSFNANYIDINLIKELYHENWIKDLKLDLTKNEKKYLYNRIINSQATQGSILVTLLKKRIKITDLTFRDIRNFLDENQKKLYDLACEFDDFQFFIKIIYYSLVYTNEENDLTNKIDEKLKIERLDIKKISKIDIDKIFEELKIKDKKGLKNFLNNIKQYVGELDLDDITKSKSYKKIVEEIKEREFDLKNERAKTKNQKKDKYSFGNYRFDYRFNNAIVIINDIIGGGYNVKSVR